MRNFICTLTLALGCAFHAQAQEYNLFPASDVDADGWLWFDSQEKIEKYVGICDEENYKIDPNGKPIQLIYANINPDYPASKADPLWVGAGTDGEIGSEGAKTGALVIAPSSSNMNANGGGFVVCMPSCASYSISLSREGKTYVRMLGTKDINTNFEDYDVISASYATVFKPLFKGGVFTWNGIETLDNGDENAYTLKSDQPIYAYFQSLTNSPIYIHGIRVMTQTNSTVDIQETTVNKTRIFLEGKRVVLNEPSMISVYGIDGRLVKDNYGSEMDLSNLTKGIYTIKAGQSSRKVVLN